ncbi:MAG: rhodanese-like domain-containing protein [Planctomycetes bacterium]|nr:rhodanese-like domain-containing protein [Planctomycetota bacterium]
MATLKDSPKMNLRTVLFLASVLLIVSNPCAVAHTDITAEQTRDLIDSTNDLVVVDVREPSEYCDATGHIPGALNYPLNSGVLEARYEELPIDGPVLVVCRSGGRSNQAANFLDSMGFSKVYDMMGGMSAWVWETVPCKDGDDGGTTDSAEMNTYVFLSGQSTVVQTGGIAGVHWIYSVEGLFQLTVDPNAGIASFAHVDAKATDNNPLQRTLNPNEVFNMTSLVGAVLDDRTISFTGKADDGSDVLITVTIEDDLAYLVGETIPPPNSADFFLFSLDAVAQRKYGGGTGEPNDPYKIATAEDLMLLGESTEDYGKHFILTADIDLDPNLPGRRAYDRAVIAPDTNDTDLWEFQGTAFTGVFDGNGHTISHLTIQGQSHLGLFGKLDFAARISDLGMEAVDVNGIGNYVGGLAGRNIGSITTSYNSGTVSGDNRVGGLVGCNEYGSIIDSYSIGTVTGDYSIGGLVGLNDHGSIAISYSTGTATGFGYVGGLVGSNECGSIIASYSTGQATGSPHVGGLVGSNECGSIAASYSTGTATGFEYVGGLVGTNGGSISTSYSTGVVSGFRSVGGLVGSNVFSSITSSFWDMETSGQTTGDGGTGLTTTEMQNINTFLNAGWDFVDETLNGTCNYWQISPGDYPRLHYHIGESPVMPEGLGTIQQPYMIRDARDLGTVWFKPVAHYRLEASLDLSGIMWSMAAIPWFGGAFDGNGHTISHLTIRGGSYLGLFGQLSEGANVSNLGLEAVDINGIGNSGGLVGLNGKGNIITCYSTGTITGHEHMGGLVGCNQYGSIIDSYSTAKVTGTWDVGGLVGWVFEGSITTSYGTGIVSGDWVVGGLVGWNGSGSIAASYSTATTSGELDVGGLAGLNMDGSITASYSTGAVTGGSSVGGLVGGNHGRIAICYSTGAVTGQKNIGGLIGDNNYQGSINSSLWDTVTSGKSISDGGTGLTTAEMQIASSFLDAGWDFVDETDNGTDDIWWILEGQDYPRLWWELVSEN